MKTTFPFLLLLLWLAGCSSDSDAYQDVPLQVAVPSNFPAMVYRLDNNQPTEKGFELGRQLFYEPKLSSDESISCGFCHVQQYAFTHHGHTVSHGVNNTMGTRNAPPIQNLAFQDTFMWDGASEHLDTQPIIPITSAIEMNGRFSTILERLQADPKYVKLFGQAFPGAAIDAEHMLRALGQFMAVAISSNARFDHYRRDEPGGTLSPDELEGYAIFNQKCASCHATDLFTDNSFRNNGLPVNPQVNDLGRFRVTQREEDRYKFRVPSLRNIEKTAPYMHDGRFYTLEAVLNHYASGVVASATLDPKLNHGAMLGIPLTADEKTKIITFLKTLTDNQYLTDPRFSETP